MFGVPLFACTATAIAAYTINLTYLSILYHRGVTHKAVTLSPVARWLVVNTGFWMTGIDPKAWACVHRLHHEHSDGPGDPHSPHQAGVLGVLRAQIAAYEQALRGLIVGRPRARRAVEDLEFAVHPMLVRGFWFAPYLLHAGVAVVLSALSPVWLVGPCYYVGLMSHPLQGWMVNALGHAKGYRNYEIADESRNNLLVAWLVAGEGFQNNHHFAPGSPKFSARWFEIDPGYGLCRLLRFAGLLSFPRPEV